ncbi:hypothetical protein DSS3P8_035 [Roseobacter phage DSS3P8]|nr:hypothetical protein DSS3P8_035 [Roseobacter phage DSS3P8]
MYHRVYAPNGEPFDVPRDRADRLILQEGWTQSPPKVVAPVQDPAPEIAELIEDEIEQPRQRTRKRKAFPDVASDE